MINRVEIENFRCLKSVDVPLKPLTVLVGPNNSGKSAFLSALGLEALANSGIARPQLTDRWLETDGVQPSVMIHLSNGSKKIIEPKPPIARGGLGGGGVVGGGGLVWTPSSEDSQPRNVSFFGRNGLIPSMQSNGLAESDGLPAIDDAAKTLPSYLDALLRLDRKRFISIVDLLERLLPGFCDLHIKTPEANTRRIDIEWKNGYTMQGQHASSGVKLLIFFVAVATHPNPPDLVLVDEPETGVHPQLLSEIVSLLRGLTDGTYADTAAQVVMSTHSPYMLDYVDTVSDQVLVAQICKDGSRSVQPIDQDRVQPFLDEFMLGEVWLNRGEAGLLSK